MAQSGQRWDIDGGRTGWGEVSFPVTAVSGKPRDLTVILTGGVRLAWFRFEAG
jgi:hypothetical protein